MFPCTTGPSADSAKSASETPSTSTPLYFPAGSELGLLLSSFGTFWAGEGAGVSWPGNDLAILGLLAVYSLTSWAYVRALRRSHREEQPAAA